MSARSYTRRQLMGGLIQELEYLEYPNAGVQFVSDYIPQGKDNVFHYKFKLIGYNGNQRFDSWIYSRASRGDSGYNYRLMASTSGWYLTVQNGRAGNSTSQNRNTVSAGTIYEYYVYKNQYYTINGTRYTYTDANCTGTNDCFLSIVDGTKKCKGRFYFLKWWKGDTLVLDWVPAIIDGNICIYDKLNKKILTRNGAGLVTAGPTIGWF